MHKLDCGRLACDMVHRIPCCLVSLQDMMQHIEAQEGHSGIIYCRTRSDCDQLTQVLNSAMAEGHFGQYDWSVGCYHAGMTQYDRHKVQRQWQDGDIVAVVATIAFGMGIDKSDIRWVMHYTLSSSLEGFAQVRLRLRLRLRWQLRSPRSLHDLVKCVLQVADQLLKDAMV